MFPTPPEPTALSFAYSGFGGGGGGGANNDKIVTLKKETTSSFPFLPRRMRGEEKRRGKTAPSSSSSDIKRRENCGHFLVCDKGGKGVLTLFFGKGEGGVSLAFLWGGKIWEIASAAGRLE